MTSERLLNMSIEVLYLPKKVYAPPPKKKHISGYAPANHHHRLCQSIRPTYNNVSTYNFTV